jgi:glucose-6-phosphate isomerase
MLTIKQERVKKFQTRLASAYKQMVHLRESQQEGFSDLPFDRDLVAGIENLSRDIKKKFNYLLVIGVGGSDLSARMLVRALANEEGWQKGKGIQVSFLSTPDPESVGPWLDEDMDWREVAVSVVSKSGTTLETMSIFSAIYRSMKQQLGEKARKHVYATTEPVDNPLYNMVLEEGFTLIPHPTNVGGRFSALSSVGLFPASCAGIDIKKLLKGARGAEIEFREKKEKSLPAQYATLLFAEYKKGRVIHIVMPYAKKLEKFGQWYRQLWAESLGKIDQKGDRVGPTPVLAMGPIDQHSQIQLYTEGPLNKVITLIEVEKFRKHPRVPKLEEKAFAYFSQKKFSSIMHAERKGTAAALKKAGVPVVQMKLEKISEESLGQLIQFFETACVYYAKLSRVDAFDQPGVEDGKKAAKRYLAKL